MRNVELQEALDSILFSGRISLCRGIFMRLGAIRSLNEHILRDVILATQIV